MNLGDKIKNTRETNGLERAELANKLGITYHALSKYETNERQPDYETLMKIAEYFSVTTDYLLGHDNLFKTTRLPMLGTIRAGLPILAEENFDGYIEVPEHLNGDFVLRVRGDSMIGVGILEDDLVICKQAQTAFSGQIVVALHDEGSTSEATLKYYYDANGNGPVLRAANPNYPAIPMSKGYRIAGVMVAMIREEAPVSNIYRDYLMISGREEWTDVIELASEAGLKVGQVKQILAGQIEIAKRLKS